MSKLAPDKKLLTYLSEFGIGNYKEISHLLKEFFPLPENIDDEIAFKNYKKYVIRFIEDLHKHDFASFIKIELTKEKYSVEAAIKKGGYEYIGQYPKSQQTTIIGDHNQVIGHESSSSKNDLIVSKSPIIETINNTKPKKPRIRLIAEMLYWIAGIVVGIALIWQTFFHNIFKNEPKNSSDTIHILQKDTIIPKKGKAINFKHKIKPNTREKQDSTNSIAVSNSSNVPAYFLSQIKKPLSFEYDTPFELYKIVHKEDLKHIIENWSFTPPITSSSQYPFLTNNLHAERHPTVFDSITILNFIPSKNFRVNINYNALDSESRSYAIELLNLLNVDSSYAIGNLPTFPSTSLTQYSLQDIMDNKTEDRDNFLLKLNMKENLVEVWIKSLK
jgi:hypothetical protein